CDPRGRRPGGGAGRRRHRGAGEHLRQLRRAAVRAGPPVRGQRAAQPPGRDRAAQAGRTAPGQAGHRRGRRPQPGRRGADHRRPRRRALRDRLRRGRHPAGQDLRQPHPGTRRPRGGGRRGDRRVRGPPWHGARPPRTDEPTRRGLMDTDWDKLRPVLTESVGTTVYMVLATFVAGGLIGLFLGTALYTTRKGGLLANAPIHWLLNVAVNIVRPIPFIILLAALGPVTLEVVGTTIGTEAAIFVMIVAASFGIARIVEQNLVTVDPGVIEAARAVGAGPLRIILTLLIPEALGPLILGYTFVIIAIVDMSAMAGTVGGGGLGNFALVYGYQRFDWEVTFVAVLIIIAGVQVVQFVGNWLARRVLRR